MNFLINYLTEDEKRILKNTYREIQESKTMSECEFSYLKFEKLYRKAFSRFKDQKFNKENESKLTVNDILTNEEKQIIAEYEEAMHKAWTKKGVLKYKQLILETIENAKKKYYEGKIS